MVRRQDNLETEMGSYDYEHDKGSADTSTKPSSQNWEPTNPPAFLRNKMISSLESMQLYTDRQIARVGKLIDDNTIVTTLSNKAVRACLGDQSTKEHWVEEFLKYDVFPCLTRINTNELVLLLEFDDWFHRDDSTEPHPVRTFHTDRRDQIESLKGMVLRILERYFGLYPVRVYVGGEMKIPDEDLMICGDEECLIRHHIRLTFLNVVNTDIGGPSMIQLLDHACEQHEWESCVAQMEARHRNEVLWRDNRLWMSSNFSRSPDDVSHGNDLPERFQDIHAQEAGEYSNEQNDGYGEVTTAASVSVIDNDEAADRLNDQEVVSKDIGKPDTPRQHPAFIELQLSESEKRQINHPTWQHAESSATLIDLINTQASQMSDTSSDVEFIDHDEGDAATTPYKDVDGFEMVPRPIEQV